MLKKSTLLHLRLPFSFFLMPVFMFSLALGEQNQSFNALLMWLILHILVYPASNAYNSYFDKDEESIGGLERPPEVSLELYWTALALDALAFLLSFWVSWQFALGVLLYGLVSKAYSHDKIRLKKYPIASWLVVGFFQGAFILLIVSQGLNTNLDIWQLDPKIYLAALLSSLMLWASYPMTQVYQHQEDAKRGDLTLSRLLGIRGTFLFTMTCFALVGIAYGGYFLYFYDWRVALGFALSLLPVLIFFTNWLRQIWQDETQADFRRTMRLNLLSAVSLNLFFTGLWLLPDII